MQMLIVSWNYISSIGSLITLISVLIFIFILIDIFYVNKFKKYLNENLYICYENLYYFSLKLNKNYNFGFNFIKSIYNKNSLEFSIKSPVSYHIFVQSAITS